MTFNRATSSVLGGFGMTRTRWASRVVVLLGIGALALAGCADERSPISQVQTNVVAKDIFQGSWYYGATVIDVDYEASSLGTYEGDSADDMSLSNNPWNPYAVNYNIARIRWVVDKDFLYAYRDYELVQFPDRQPDRTNPTEL